MVKQLTKSEIILCETIVLGERKAFKKPTKIRAVVIRNLLLGLPLPTFTKKSGKNKTELKTYPLVTGLWIENALIDGRINIDGLSGQSFPRLKFHKCIFDGGITGDHAQLGPVELVDCKFRDGKNLYSPENKSVSDPNLKSESLNFYGADIRGDFIVKKCGADSETGLFDICLKDANICGSVKISQTHLKARLRSKRPNADIESYYTLNMDGAAIETDLILEDDFISRGIIRIKNAKIGADVWMLGVNIDGHHADQSDDEKESTTSIYAQGIKVAGSFIMRDGISSQDKQKKPCELTGDLNFHSAKIFGELELTDIKCSSRLVLSHGKFGIVTIEKDILKSNYFSDCINAEYAVIQNDFIIDTNLMLKYQKGVYLNLPNIKIGGDLDLTGLQINRFAEYKQLILKRAKIGHHLKFRRNFSHPPRLIQARKKIVKALPNTELFETLWKIDYENSETGFSELGFLIHQEKIILLNGSSSHFHELAENNKFQLQSENAAADFLKIFCKYLDNKSDDGIESHSFIIVTDPKDLEAYDIDHSAISKKIEYFETHDKTMEGEISDIGPKVLEELQDSQHYKSVNDIPEDWFKFSIERNSDNPENFMANVAVLIQNNIYRCQFNVSSHNAEIQMIDDQIKGIELKNGYMRYGAQFQYKHTSDDEINRRWGFITPETVKNMDIVEGKERKKLETHLLPHCINSFATLQHFSYVDLEDCHCVFLHDYGGAALQKDTKVNMARFKYEQSDWAKTGTKNNIVKNLGNILDKFIQDYTPNWSAKLWFNLSKKQEANSLKAYLLPKWEARRYWLGLQYHGEYPSTLEHLSTTKRAVKREYYDPFPFEQAIRNSHKEGHDDFARRFEIEKKNIEWQRRADQSRDALFSVGLILATFTFILGTDRLHHIPDGFWATLLTPLILCILALLIRYVYLWYKRKSLIGADKEYDFFFPPPKIIPNFLRGGLTNILSPWLFVFLVGLYVSLSYIPQLNHLKEALLLTVSILGVLGFVTYASNILNGLVRWGYGYFRKPLNGVVVVIIAFLMGWGGVYKANKSQKLIVSIAPVAPLVSERGDEIIIGSEYYKNTAELVGRIPCGDNIVEPLYALDVLIPLINLKQEEKCEVGDASLSAKTERQAINSLHGWSAPIWSGLKALYTIIGWIVISLLILTFTFSFRTQSSDVT